MTTRDDFPDAHTKQEHLPRSAPFRECLYDDEAVKSGKITFWLRVSSLHHLNGGHVSQFKYAAQTTERLKPT